ncbi:MAG TPA: sigma-70 family RNA polymerase sigma factor [Actinomycetales bacterium]|nr:sigma-70 family RNA polymerase sigma factor [Actinomycetales bacterium]
MTRLPRQASALLPRQTGRADADATTTRVSGRPTTAQRDRVVEEHLPLVRALAARYRHLGEPLEDLLQVGTIGLIQAVDRYDADRGVALAGYATPFILGEIRRHLRDRAGAVRIPRQVHDVQARVARAVASLNQQLQRPPTVAEIAAATDVDADLVVETLEVRRTCATVPLDTTRDGGEVSTSRLRRDTPGASTRTDSALVHDETALDDVLHRVALRPVLARLDEREKRILVLRFFRGLSQREIAVEVGLSQMHVSRLLARTLDRIRAQVEAPE